MIPLISNIAITEVSSSGTLNTKAGNAVALPVQYFKLTGNISGNLLLSNNANHKKIILDKVNSMIKKYVEIEERDYYYEDDDQYIKSIYLEAFDTCKFKLRQTKWNINSGEYEKFNPIIYN